MYSLKVPKIVHAGTDALSALVPLLHGARRVAVFTDRGVRDSGVLDRPLQLIRRAGAEPETLCSASGEPTCQQAQDMAETFQRLHADAIVAVGGGSVMDIAKLCSIAADGAYTIADLMDDPSIGRKQTRAVMIPTTAGTGAEATPNAIVAVPEKQMKVGVVCEEMIPDAVVLDGEMIRRLPQPIAASTGVDALCHAIECFTSRKATPISDLFALEALGLIFAHIESACMDENALDSKNAMLLAAFYAGVAITCSGTTAVHALSYPLGGRYHIPHGMANAMLLTPVLRLNRDDCLGELGRVYDRVRPAEPLPGNAEKADWVLGRMESIIQTLRLPMDLKAFGVKPEDLDELVAAGMSVERLLVNNKRILTAEDARRLYLERMV